MSERWLWLLSVTGALGCQESAPPAQAGPSAVAAPAAPSAGASAALTNTSASASASAAAAERPIDQRFVELSLRQFPGGLVRLSATDPDLPRTVATLRGPQQPIKQLVSGSSSFCALLHEGNVRCFGGALDGQSEIGVVQVASGADFAVGVGLGGKLATVGKSPVRVEADDPLGRRDAPDAGGRLVEDHDRAFKAVGAQGQHACAVERQGEVRCWSKDPRCELTPPAELRARQVAVGEQCFACATSESGLSCWGTAAPVQQDSLKPEQLVAGGSFICGLSSLRATCFGVATPPGEVRALAAAGPRLCWLDAAGKLLCSGGGTPSLEGAHSALAITAGATCVADAAGYWRCDGATPPESDYLKSHPSWAPDKPTREQRVSERRALLQELAARFPARDLPIEIGPDAEFPVGPRVETRYLALLQNVGLDWPLRSSERQLRYAFRLTGLLYGTQLVLATDGALELYAFDDNAELQGKLLLAARRPYDFVLSNGCVYFNETNSVREELWTARIDANGTVKARGQRTRELKEFEPIQKRDVFQCHVMTSELTAVLGGKRWQKSETGWTAKENRIGKDSCEGLWPLGSPFWIPGEEYRGGSSFARFQSCAALR